MLEVAILPIPFSVTQIVLLRDLLLEDDVAELAGSLATNRHVLGLCEHFYVLLKPEPGILSWPTTRLC